MNIIFRCLLPSFVSNAEKEKVADILNVMSWCLMFNPLATCEGLEGAEQVNERGKECPS